MPGLYVFTSHANISKKVLRDVLQKNKENVECTKW